MNLQIPERPIPGILAKGSVLISISIGSNYGTSSIELVIEALQIHRDQHLELCFTERANGEYDNAYVYWRGYQSIQGVLDHMTSQLGYLAEYNGDMCDTKGTSEEGTRGIEHHKRLKERDYQSFLKKFIYGQDAGLNEPTEEELDEMDAELDAEQGKVSITAAEKAQLVELKNLGALDTFLKLSPTELAKKILAQAKTS